MSQTLLSCDMNKKINSIRRWKSMSSLRGTEASFCDYGHSCSGSEASVTCVDSECDTSECKMDSGVEDGEVLVMLEEKVDRLSDLFLEQCRLLTEIRSDVNNSTPMIDDTQNKLVNELLKKAIAQRLKELESVDGESEDLNTRARSLLDAIEVKRVFCLDREIRDALEDFLQSDEVKDHMVAATVESLRGLVYEQFTRDVSNLYLPMLECWHRRLARQVTRVLEAAFMDLEKHSASFSHSIFKISRSLRHALVRHHNILEGAGYGRDRCNNLHYVVEQVLKKELKQWRQEALNALCITPELISEEEPESPPPEDYSTPSPPQPADPEVSIIDQLMMSAEINKKIQDGDLNGSFETALSAGDLALVMTACRAADPNVVFATPCCLSQPVLLSLSQQLATDMVHDTQLKCRYLEETLIHLNTSNPATCTHLPLVLGEVRKHLTTFLATYPGHLASRRVALIVMAANNLLK